MSECESHSWLVRAQGLPRTQEEHGVVTPQSQWSAGSVDTGQPHPPLSGHFGSGVYSAALAAPAPPAPKPTLSQDLHCGSTGHTTQLTYLLCGLKKKKKNQEISHKNRDFRFLLKRSKDLAMWPHASRLGQITYAQWPGVSLFHRLDLVSAEGAPMLQGHVAPVGLWD